MNKQKKVLKEKQEMYGLLSYLVSKGYYNHNLEDRKYLYSFMYHTYGTSWHKVNYYLFKKVSKDLLDELSY